MQHMHLHSHPNPAPGTVTAIDDVAATPAGQGLGQKQTIQAGLQAGVPAGTATRVPATVALAPAPSSIAASFDGTSSSDNSSSSSASYSSWTVPSLDNLFSARRASAFGARYSGLISSHASTLIPGRTSPATSGMSMMLEGGSTSASLQSKTRKMSLHMSESITNVLNDSSLVLYRVNEHIHKKVPQLVEEKKALAMICRSVDTATQDLEDARQTIAGIQRIPELGAIEALVKRALIAARQ